MSSFKCSNKHMQYIANGLFSISDLSNKEEKDVIEKVNRYIDINIEALNQRYGKTPEMYQGFKYIKRVNTDLNLNIFQLLKALSCLRYQCSEGNVPETKAYKELNNDIINLMYEIIYKMPEYENSEWEIA